MGMVIDCPESGIDYVLYGDKSGIISNYLYNQIQAIPQVFNEFSQRVYNGLQSSYNFVNDKLTQYGIMNQIKNNGVSIVDNYYDNIQSFTDLQDANMLMQRWVMAHPSVRQLYLDQNLDGYSSTYNNVFGKDVGDKDYNYRRVMDGSVVDQEDSFVIKHYDEPLMVGDRELNHFEKTKVLNAWDCIDWLLETSPFDFTCKSKEPVIINRP